MIETVKKIIKDAIILPLRKHIVCVFFGFGLFTIIIGSTLGDSIDSLAYIPSGTGLAILKFGSAVLGAGVFAAIMKSAQFTEVFQDHIYDVFYKPSSLKTSIPIIEKWRILTQSLLNDLLPKTHFIEASKKIEQQFFNDELEYHFEDLDTSYEINIRKKIANIKNVQKSTIIVAPHSKEPFYKQEIERDSKTKLTVLRFNGKDITKEHKYKKIAGTVNKYSLKVPLSKYSLDRANGDKIIEVVRITEWSQDLNNDPLIAAEISRYIKGATARVKISKGFRVFFTRFGLGDMPKDNYDVDDGYGFEKWTLCSKNNTLLPGQGYIYMIVGNK